jgi:DNA-binding MarR family transcriptional regulator
MVEASREEPYAGGVDEEPRWLDEDERRAWVNLVGVLVRLPALLDADLQRGAGLSHFEYGVLAGLSESPDRTLRMSQLARLANGSLSRLSHGVRRLEQRGWVQRRACPGDGRATIATLTDAGMAKVVEAAPGHVATVRALVLDALEPEEVARLEVIAGRLLARLDEGLPCGDDASGPDGPGVARDR